MGKKINQNVNTGDRFSLFLFPQFSIFLKFSLGTFKMKESYFKTYKEMGIFSSSWKIFGL